MKVIVSHRPRQTPLSDQTGERILKSVILVYRRLSSKTSEIDCSLTHPEGFRKLLARKAELPDANVTECRPSVADVPSTATAPDLSPRDVEMLRDKRH